MIICICHRVSDRDIARSVREGCSSFDELQAELAVATGCGACHDCAQASFHELRQQVLDGTATAALAAPALQAVPAPVRMHVPVRVLRRLHTAPAYTAGDAGLAGATA